MQCYLCSHKCIIKPSQYGLCRVRKNIDGVLYTLVYGKIIAENIDPIEKKPLYHFLPGTNTFSIAAPGCNFKCRFCQNWQISQVELTQDQDWGKKVSPKEVVQKAKEYGCQSISFTYTEPTVFFEYAYDIAKIAKQEGLYTTFVTNGYMSPEAIEKINPYLDAVNVDLKSFREEFYKSLCKAKLEPVLNSIRAMKKAGLWVEVTTLIVPGQNSSFQELKDIANFISSLGKETPWHISRFHPDYQCSQIPATPMDKLKEAETLGRLAGLKYVYLGNISSQTNTYCYKCKRILIKRIYFSLEEYNLRNSKCQYCGETLDGFFLLKS